MTSTATATATSPLGNPYGTVGTKANAGFITIVYGSASGITTTKKQVASQDTAGVPGAAEAGDNFGAGLGSADLDLDGYADLIVGAPGEDTGDGANAGTHTVFWGGPTGLTASGSIAEGEPRNPGANHKYGASIASGDLNGDHQADMVIAAPGAAVVHAYGRHTVGAGTASVDALNLATGDVNGDGIDDLTVGVRDSDATTAAKRRYVLVFTGGPTALTAGTAIATTDLYAVAVGDFNGDTFDDVAVGEPSDTAALGGRVSVYRGSATGITTTPYRLTQDSAYVPGPGEKGDAFGTALAAGDVNGDGKADLAVGNPGEQLGSPTKAGGTYLLKGGANGLSGAGSQGITQSFSGVPGSPETGDQFGWQTALLDHNADGKADLSVGAPGENAGDGMVAVLKGASTGLTGTGCVGLYATTFAVTGKNAQVGVRIGRS